MLVAGSPVSRRLLPQKPNVGKTQGSTVLVMKGSIRPLGDFVTDAVDVLERPAAAAVGLRDTIWSGLRGPGERLHWLVAVAIRVLSLPPGTMETSRADVERILATVE